MTASVGLTALTAVANTVTPSAGKRALWMPVTFATLAAALIVSKA